MHINQETDDNREQAFTLRFMNRMDDLLKYATVVTRDQYAAEDIISDVYVSTLRAIRGGKGPTTADLFEAYVRSAIRNAAAKNARDHGRVMSVAEPDEVAEQLAPSYAPERSWNTWDADDIRNAFLQLPVRDQHILYLSEVEQYPHRVIAEQLGMRVNTVTVVAHRAKALLRTKYLEQAVTDLEQCPSHPHGRAAAYVSKTLSRLRRDEFERHLEDCADCQRIVGAMRSMRLPVAALIGIVWVGSGRIASTKPLASRHTARVNLGRLRRGKNIAIASASALVVAAATITLLSATATKPSSTNASKAAGTVSTDTNLNERVASFSLVAQPDDGLRCYAPTDLLQRSGSLPSGLWSFPATTEGKGSTGVPFTLTITNVSNERQPPYILRLVPAQGTHFEGPSEDCTQAGSNLICAVDHAALSGEEVQLRATISASPDAIAEPPTIQYLQVTAHSD